MFNIINNKGKIFSKIILFLILFTTIYFIFLTQSRNAILSLLISLSITLGIKFTLISIALGLIFFSINFFFIPNIEFDYIVSLIRKNILEYQRLEIWKNSITFIKQKPLLGWGAGTFASLYLLNDGLYKAQHSHNLILQIAQTYGLPCAIIISSTIVYLIINSAKIALKEKSPKNSIKKYWVISLIVISLHQLFDIVLFEGRLNLLFCLILAGCKTISEENFTNKA